MARERFTYAGGCRWASVVQTMAPEVWHRQEGDWREVESVMEESEAAHMCLPGQYLPLAGLLGNMSPRHADAVSESRPETIVV